MSAEQSVSQADLDAIAGQLGRPPRGVLEVSYRSPDGRPGVVKTAPRLEDGTPFPTLYYLTDPRLTAEASRQESAGIMRGMTTRLSTGSQTHGMQRDGYRLHPTLRRGAAGPLDASVSGPRHMERF